MPITRLEIQQQGIEHPLGGDMSDDFDMAKVVNRAGNALYRMHQWEFRIVGPVDVPLVVNQDHVHLPKDFGTMIALHMKDNLNGTVRQVTEREIGLHRSTSVIASASHFWATTGRGLGANRGRVQLKLYPTPTEGDTLQLWYRSTWLDLEEDDATANIPDYCIDLLVEVTAAYALGYEERERGTIGERMKIIKEGPIFEDAKIEDGLSQTELGPIVGGAVEPRGIAGVLGDWAPYKHTH